MNHYFIERRRFIAGTLANYTHRLIVALLAGLVGLIVHSTAFAQSPYPQRIDRQINDYASILGDTDRMTIRGVQSQLLRDQGVELVVVTINSVNDYDVPDQTIESFATNLFNSWGIGDRQRNDGVLLLVAVKDRKVRIEVGSGYGDSYDSAMQRVIDTDILPSFRGGKYGQGIENGVRGIQEALIAVPSKLSTINASLPIVAGVLIGVLALLLGTGKAVLQRQRRRRSQPSRQRVMCKHCRRPMDELGFELVDADLDAGQRIERQLGSMNYQLWECRSCGDRKRESSPGATLRYRACPKCRYRTLEDGEQVTQQPSHTRRGLKVTTRRCHYCGYSTEFKTKLAKKQAHSSRPGGFAAGTGAYDRSSSSSYDYTNSSTPDYGSPPVSDTGGSSFDSGGSSSGDGASGSW